MFVRAANLRGGRQARKMAVGSPLFRMVLIREVLILKSLASVGSNGPVPKAHCSAYVCGQAFRVAAIDRCNMAFNTFRSMSANRFT